jgi:homoserine O-acetyltransferase
MPKKYDICLVSMPYADLKIPSLALGLLKAVLESSGLSVKVVNANLLFAQHIGLERFIFFAHKVPMPLMVGEWSFSTSAFPLIDRDDKSYFESCKKMIADSDIGYSFPEPDVKLECEFMNLRSHAESFIPDVTQIILETGAKIVGCSSTFEQHIPSIALLKHLKTEAPEIVNMIGGANCESEMGLATHRNYPWIDYVVSGEADEIITDLCKSILLNGREVPIHLLPDGILGPLHRLKAVKPTTGRIKVTNLDRLPIPDFSDYFHSLTESELSSYIKPALPVETSRGCWWGAKHHCTFCGLNGNGMGFRSKSPERVMTELETLEKQYAISDFEVVDNILDMSYFNTLLPSLSELTQKRNIFFEVKSNLSRDKVSQLKKAGINWIQPGIESLHSQVLELMDKGVTAWQNIQLLKWCREFGIRLSWSILYNFPGERQEWYYEMAEWIPLLEHLQAPIGLFPLRFDRFSVYHTNAAKMGLDLLPFPSYSHIYGLPLSELKDIAYFFTSPDSQLSVGDREPAQEKKEDTSIYRSFKKKVKTWQNRFWQPLPPLLCMEEKADSLIIFDSRSCSKQFKRVLSGLSRTILLATDNGPMEEGLIKLLQEQVHSQISSEEIRQTILDLKEWGYILEVDNRLVNLAVRGNIPTLSTEIDFPGGSYINFNQLRQKSKQTASAGGETQIIARDQTAYFDLPLALDSGEQLPEFSIAYQTYGIPNDRKSNSILVLHPFTKNAHLAGRYAPQGKEAGWWDSLVGPGKPLDTTKYHVVCSNVLGGSGGSTGPSSQNPLTGVPYGMAFPIITIGDMVNAQKRLMDRLGIKKWAGIIGGCFGGEQALEWLARHPQSVGSAVIISTTPSTSTHTIALSTSMRNLICNDPHWNGGNYYGKTFPTTGLTQGIISAFPIWMSRQAMHAKFGRRRIVEDKTIFTFEPDFEVEKFMLHMSENAQKSFDPNSLLYLSKAAEYFDLPYYYGSLENAFKNVSSPILLISYRSDWRYPPEEVDQLHSSFVGLGIQSEHLVLDHAFGHGAFVFDPSGFSEKMTAFFNSVYSSNVI